MSAPPVHGAVAAPPADPPVQPRYPESFFRFLVIAFVVVASPLVISLVQLTMESATLARNSESAVRRVASVIDDVEVLARLSFQMERVLRQSAALTEAVPADDFDPLHREFEQTAQRLQAASLPTEMATELRQVLGALAGLQARVANQEVLSQLPPELARMESGIDKLSEVGIQAASQEIEAVRAMADQTQQQTAITFGVAVSLAVLLASVFTVLLARPVRRIEKVIRQLGAGQMDEAIHIGGPRDLRLLGERLEWLRQRLKELEADRELLTRSISHDLKTPLTSIHEGAELLMQGVAGPLNPRQLEIADIMQGSVLAMAEKIESLIAVRSSALRDAPVALRRIELRDLIQKVVDDHRLSARAKNLQIAVQGPPLHLSGDAAKLRIVFDNLLSNAIRYSPKNGRVQFDLSTDEDTAWIAVSDDGPGVPASAALRVFDPGYRVPAAPESPEAANNVKGSGVGLSIAREFVLAHGGHVELDQTGSRTELRGACFLIRLPGVIPMTEL
jgi:two-component system, NtrC family, sensor histidine kinase GlrK